jgi:ankyrin repeat protein
MKKGILVLLLITSVMKLSCADEELFKHLPEKFKKNEKITEANIDAKIESLGGYEKFMLSALSYAVANKDHEKGDKELKELLKLAKQKVSDFNSLVNSTDIPDESGESLLILAIRAKNIKAVETLVLSGADVNKSSRATFAGASETPLIAAVNAGWALDDFKRLVAHGADINKQTGAGHTVLMVAGNICNATSREILDYLLKHPKIDRNLRNARGKTAEEDADVLCKDLFRKYKYVSSPVVPTAQKPAWQKR